ncbi:MAG: hypothetical protein L0226_06585 [Acidobacteria bacterium]|nr:hypothetical protein [Acidobacteriota bacterium]
MIDLNNLLLDDEFLPVDLSTVLEICEKTYRDGVEEIVLTLRMTQLLKGDCERTRAFECRLRELRERLSEKSEISLRLSCGYEWILSDDLPGRIREFAAHPAINESNYLLISFPSLFATLDYKRVIGEIRADGYIPIISHPECSRGIRRNHSIIDKLIKLGCLMQADAMSVTGGYTKEIEFFTRELLERGQIHFIATRAGRQPRCEASLSTAFERAGRIIGRSAARCLVEGNPLSVLTNVTTIEKRNRNTVATALPAALNSRA